MATISYDEIELKLTSSATLNGIDKAIKALESLKDASKDGMSGLGTASENINKFVTSLRSVNKDIVNQYKSLAESISQISKSGSSAKKVMESIGDGAKSAVKEVESVRKSYDGLVSSGSSEAYNPFAHHGRMSQQQMDWYSDRLRHGGVDSETYKTSEAAKRIAEGTQKATEEFQKLTRNIKDASDEANNFEQNVADLVSQLKDAPPTTNSFLKLQGYSTQEIIAAKQELANQKFEEQQVAKAAKEKAKAEAQAAKGVKDLGTNAKSALNPIEKLANRLKNLLMYRVLRNIISGMGNAIKEGFTNLEQWDRKQGNTGFADAMDRARESLTVLKNSLAVVGAPFLEFLITLLEKVARLTMAAANAISRFIAILSGKSTYRVVEWAEYSAKATDDYGHSLGKAAKDAKEFKRQLMGFDEINNITEKNGSGTGSGGGSGASKGGFNFKDMFTEQDAGKASEFLEKIKAVIDRIVEAWGRLKASVSQLADTVKNVLTKALENHPGLVENVLGLVGDIVIAVMDIFTFVADITTKVVELADALGIVDWIFGEVDREVSIIRFIVQQISLEAQREAQVIGGIVDWVIKAIEAWNKGVDDVKKRFKDAFDNVKQKVIEIKGKLDEWWTSLSNTFTNVKRNLSAFINGFKKARSNGAGLFEAVQAGLDAMGQTETPQKMKDMLEEVTKSGATGFQTLGQESQKTTDIIGQQLEKTGVSAKKTFTKVEEDGKKPFIQIYNTGTTKLKQLGSEAKIYLDPIGESANGAGDRLIKHVGRIVDEVRGKLKTAFSSEYYTDIYGRLHVAQIDTSGLGNTKFKFIQEYASGGFPSTGQLFIAREAGAEMVGSIGGHTAVANNADIVNAVASGVASAVASVMSGANTNVEVVLEGDAKGLFRVVQQQARNYAVQTGKYAFG